MPRTIRFHLDENVPAPVALGLRRLAIDVTTANDAGLLSRPDTDHIAFALAQERVLFTLDRGFMALAAGGVPHRGLVYCRPRSRSIGQMIEGLKLIWETYEPNEMHGRVEFL